MNRYSSLLGYLDFFERYPCENRVRHSPANQQEDGSYALPYLTYDKQLIHFIEDFYESGLMDTDYMQTLSNAGISTAEHDKSVVEQADLSTLRAILTFYIRMDRFCEGSILWASENRILYSILLRLKQLTES